MKTTFFTSLLMSVILLAGCTESSNHAAREEADSTAAAGEEISEAMRRNMFGHHLTRGVTVKSPDLADDMVLFVKPNSGSVYLINRDGQMVHEWKSRYNVMGAYLQDDGSIFVNAMDPDRPVFYGGGAAGRIQHLDWDSRLLWDFEYATREYLHHHDFAVMPNGNVLAIAWEAKSMEEALEAGRKPEFAAPAGMWPDKIVEIKPTGKDEGEIVWEWHMWDHLIQDHDPSKSNYGNVADHPELLDINAMAEEVELIHPDSVEIQRDSLEMRKARGEANVNAELYTGYCDVYHLNAINYNPELDQIVVSSPEIGEIFVIDHSTTKEEASSHRGGKSGMGGDLLYRWGNPANYQRGDSTDRKIFYQHDVRWVEKGKQGEGHITLYNNNIPGGPDSAHYSAIYELETPLQANGTYQVSDNEPFGPEEPYWVYVAPDTVSFWGSFISGAHRTEYGTTFINEGPKGRFFEVTSDGEVVWEFLNPFRGNATRLNGDPVRPMPMTYSQFRATLIPKGHPALQNKDLSPLKKQPKPFRLPPPPSEDKKDSLISQSN